MRKFIKYEIKGNYKFILGILAIVIIASSIIQGAILNEVNRLDESSSISPFLFIIAILVIFGAFLVAFIHIVGSFKKELYEDRGYLTFTLPLTGNQILGAKLIVAFIWYIVLGLVTVLYNLSLATILFKIDWGEFLQLSHQLNMEGYLTLVSKIIGISIIGGIISIIFTLTMIYFSMALGKVSFRNTKIGGLWFIIFLIAYSLVNLLIGKIANAIPLYLNLDTLRLSNMEMRMPMVMSHDGIYGAIANLNITILILTVLASAVAFISTSYLIEKRIDL